MYIWNGLIDSVSHSWEPVLLACGLRVLWYTVVGLQLLAPYIDSWKNAVQPSDGRRLATTLLRKHKFVQYSGCWHCRKASAWLIYTDLSCFGDEPFDKRVSEPSDPAKKSPTVVHKQGKSTGGQNSVHSITDKWLGLTTHQIHKNFLSFTMKCAYCSFVSKQRNKCSSSCKHKTWRRVKHPNI